MLQPQELRIGNLIKWGVHFCTVESFTRTDTIDTNSKKETSIFTDKTIGPIKLSEFEPIPLTEQWLEDFGFEFGVDVLEWGIDLGGDTSLHVFEEKKRYFCCIKELDESVTLPQEIGAVHILQNLFYALTGQELELKAQSHES